jgi:hypothetical protein
VSRRGEGDHRREPVVMDLAAPRPSGAVSARTLSYSILGGLASIWTSSRRRRSGHMVGCRGVYRWLVWRSSVAPPWWVRARDPR